MAAEAGADGHERLDRLMKKALEKQEDPTTPSRWTKVSKAFGIAGLVAVVGGIALVVLVTTTSLAEQPKVGGPIQGAGMLGILLGPFFMIKFIYDLNKPAVADRSAPERSLHAYLQSVRAAWWAGAFSCLSWSAKDGSVARRDDLAALDLEETTISILSPVDLRDYWVQLLIGGRQLSVDRVRTTRVGEDRALLNAELIVTIDLNNAGSRAREGGALIRNKNVVQFNGTWCAYRREGLWYLLEAGLPEGTLITRKA
jgi:hypothetical protein